MPQPLKKIDARSFPWGRMAILVVLAIVLAGVSSSYLWTWLDQEKEVPESNHSLFREKFAEAIRPQDLTPVIGVSAGGRHRAYTLQALTRLDEHIYNDLLGSVPITVTYCNLDDCVKVFTAPNRDQPLDIAFGGPDLDRRRKLWLRVGETLFRQDTEKPVEPGPTKSFPYAKTDFVRTTWGEWKKAHPDTDLYVGRLPFIPQDPDVKYVVPTEK
jgi:hypothetical protein